MSKVICYFCRREGDWKYLHLLPTGVCWLCPVCRVYPPRGEKMPGDLLESQFTSKFEPWFAMINASLRNLLPPGFPTIVTLCGSTRFKQEFIDANFRETMAGKIVLSVGLYCHADSNVYNPTEDEKEALDNLHFRKIDVSDEVLILNLGGYIGASTRNELEYARRRGKVIRFLEPENAR